MATKNKAPSDLFPAGAHKRRKSAAANAAEPPAESEPKSKLNARAIYPAAEPQFVPFPSRRSVVHSTKGIVSSTQPLASQAGLRILLQGGNCADAAVATAAALNMTEPGSTGIGGDMFCLFYSAATRRIHALNGSGRSGLAMTLAKVRAALGLADGEPGAIPMDSAHSVTVPGAAAGWVDCVERFGSGKVGMGEILRPAIELGEDGFPVSELSATFWQNSEGAIKRASPNFAEILKPDGAALDGCRAPRAGELMRNPTLARTFRMLAAEGKRGFYEGRVAEELVKAVKDRGGLLELEDLAHHMETGSEVVDPIALRFRAEKLMKAAKTNMGEGPPDVDVWEHPPNGQGLVALMALGMLEELAKEGKVGGWEQSDHNGTDHLHAVIETLRLAFSDGAWFITDPTAMLIPPSSLLSPSYLATRASLFSPDRAATLPIPHGHPSATLSPAHQRSDTVYFAATDGEGNAISFINSNYGGFGSAIVPKGCGFTLQNRGANFSLSERHPNVLAPRKRPYHTIIPAMVTEALPGLGLGLEQTAAAAAAADTAGEGNGEVGSSKARPSGVPAGPLLATYGVMGGFMQPQGHVQVLLNMLVFGLSPQAALDAPRVCIGAGMPDDKGQVGDATVYIEEGIRDHVAVELVRKGHVVKWANGFARGVFGRGQVIRAHEEEGTRVWSSGSDPRGDGAAVPL
ncbi:gamma-glutamyltranspeptidase [Lineolata rhizophorae]|uniref:Gamma-glutamyltranspeptidase n=1 Tax=Lineolata rhizophorae TaxID=578093 RepID=A0A6A6P438_9PEZI|nr:gamma-glutamyltranspeptidase [Lineolata rhizophorae]